jgi:predicted AAA+ superfamily ATPase
MALTPWREAAIPQREVYEGRYEQARFAADLGKVLAGSADSEYQDGAEFYARTYLTDGMRRLLIDVVERVAGTGGEPLVQLKTAFGGGKTHSLLAIYHLLTGGGAAGWRGVPELLAEAGLAEVPRARVAVIVGTDLDATVRHPDASGNGVEVATLWGELAAQLGGREGYAMVEAADRSGKAPGANTLAELFDRFGPAVVLIDELVAYVRNLHGETTVPGGSFGSNLTFVQALTDAAAKSANSCVLAAIPESRIEVGTAAGQEALERIEHLFARKEAVWQPVREEESFEVVRRRLFSDRIDVKARDATCRAFAKMYADETDFPADAREGTYLDRLRSAYPIHPEVFDRLYRDWSTIEEFQRTRGVLRLMAAVIHGLWSSNDRSPLILPGTIPLGKTRVRNELTKYVGDVWNAVVDSDVDGDSSAPARLDRQVDRFGQVQAAERLTRTIFMATAPQAKAGGARGVEDVRVRLGAMLPGESVSTFNDALDQLQKSLVYLYHGNGRFWFDTHPNLVRTASDRASRLDRDNDVLPHIAGRLKELARNPGDFHAVHVAPASVDVPDEDRVRLVILPPTAVHSRRKDAGETPAIKAAADILDRRGLGPRLLKNMLVFVTPDAEYEESLEAETRRFMAWKSIVDDEAVLNLGRAELKQATATRDQADAAVTARLRETYSWLIAPRQAQDGSIELTPRPLAAGEEGPAVRASAALRSSEELLTRWSPQGLQIELDRVLWKDRPGLDLRHINLKKLWMDLCSYPYLPRLRDRAILEETIREAVRSKDYLGYATSVKADGTYAALAFGAPVSAIYFDDDAVIVKPEAAAAQVAREAQVVIPPGGEHAAAGAAISDAGQLTWGSGAAAGPVPGVTVYPGTATGTGSAGQPAALTRFHGTVDVDPVRARKVLTDVVDEVLVHLAAYPDAMVRVSLDIEATSARGFDSKTVLTLSENAKSLKFRSHGFEEE